MSILSSLGINIAAGSVRGLDTRTQEEYFSRYARIKNAVEHNPVILANINNAFCNEYLETKLHKNLLRLGRGQDYSVYSIYNSSIDDNGSDVSLALRLKHVTATDKRFYRLKDVRDKASFQLFSELSSFSKCFVKGVTLPYFQGLVEWTGPGRFEEGVVGFITEDVTKRMALKSSLRRDIFADYLQVTDTNGKVNDFLIDVITSPGYTLHALKYGSNPIKIRYSLYVTS